MKKAFKRLTASALTAAMIVTAMGGTAFAVKTPFTDVTATDWYSSYVGYAYAEGIFVGTSATTFSPLREISRAELVTALGNMHQKITSEDPKEEAIAPTFADVKSGQYYTHYVGWAQKNGLIAGYPDGSFRPNEPITREMLAVILNNYIKISNITLEAKKDTFSGYTDQDTISAWATNAVNTMTEYGFLSGLPDKSFAPKRNTTRAETCTVVTQVYQALKSQIETNVTLCTEREGKTGVVLEDEMLQDCFTLNAAETDDISAKQNVARIEPMEDQSVSAGDIVLILNENPLDHEGMTRVMIPYGDVPSTYGYIASDQISTAGDAIKKGNQALVMDCDCYDKPDGMVTETMSGAVQILSSDNGWRQVEQLGTGAEAVWVRTEQLSFDFNQSVLDIAQ